MIILGGGMDHVVLGTIDAGIPIGIDAQMRVLDERLGCVPRFFLA
jgi:hypothetical protein